MAASTRLVYIERKLKLTLVVELGLSIILEQTYWKEIAWIKQAAGGKNCRICSGFVAHPQK